MCLDATQTLFDGDIQLDIQTGNEFEPFLDKEGSLLQKGEMGIFI